MPVAPPVMRTVSFIGGNPPGLEHPLQIVQVLIAADDDDLIPGEDLGVASGNDEIAVPGDRNDNALVRQVQLGQGGAVFLIMAGDLHLADGGFPPVDREQLLDDGGVDLPLDEAGDVVGAGDGNIHAELLHHLEVLGVVDPGDGAPDPIALFGQLAGDEFGLVLAGGADKGVTLFHPGGLQRLEGGAVPLRTGISRLLAIFWHSSLLRSMTKGLCPCSISVSAR